MNNRKVLSKIVAMELVGFSAVTLTFWLCELIELPHLLFGTPETPINWAEAGLETAILLVCGGWVVFQTRRLIKQIRYLEGFLHVCAFCRKINVKDDQWIPLETYIKQRTEAQISHSFCPECYEKHFSRYEGEEDQPPAKV